jgi:hypothetical protein
MICTDVDSAQFKSFILDRMAEATENLLGQLETKPRYILATSQILTAKQTSSVL